ncbi:MAG: ABC transporter ATP-binding protein [Deltaproteobacteria bacterium]|nr:MAG: ABC transporter ATP-binding protein [Deltaproteobacteria bacterium]
MNDSKQHTLLACEGLVKLFDGVTAVDHVKLSLLQGELLAILGPSGCGKSTLLRMIAGLSQPDAGIIRYQNAIWADDQQFVKPEQRDCGMVFQDMALFPHLSIGENIGFAIPPAQKSHKVKEMLSLVNLEGMEQRMAHELSGGQQQRVALARSLAPGPGLLLLDEPFSSLDLRLRQEMRREVRKILKQQGVTAILVTHDQNEAFAFADTVAVMFQGRIEQHASPQTLYQQPATQNTAAFVGDANFIEMEKALVLFPGLERLDTKLKRKKNVLMCRPEDVVLNQDGCNAKVIGTEFQGGWRELTLRCTHDSCQAELMARTDALTPWSTGETLMAIPLCGCIYAPDGRLQGTVQLHEN